MTAIKWAERFIKTSPSDWDKLFKRMDKEENPVSLQELERNADHLAQKLVMISEYLAVRGAAGCGDGGHENALAASGKRVVKVRKVLGYTQP